jgi:hypothetical protein
MKTIPEVRKRTLRVDFSKEREWVLTNGANYVGEWVVVKGDALLGHTADNEEVRRIIELVQSSGVLMPYVRFIEEREGVWLGAL